MQLGYGSITCQQHPGRPADPADLVRDAIGFAEDAERLGFDSVWVSERHFFDDGYVGSVLTLCAALAARTSRVRVGTDVALAPLYEPIRLAEDAAAVDLISGGRFVLGLGLGSRAEEFDGMRVPRCERARRMEDTIATLRQAWSDGLVTGGETIRYPGVPVTPKPAQPGGPPVWMGGTVERAVRRAGRLGDGFLASWSTVDEFARNVSLVREELARAGRDPASFRFAIVHPTFAWDEGDAWAVAREPFLYYAWKYGDMEHARGRTGPAPLPAPDARDEARLRETAVVGSPEQVAGALRRYAEVVDGDLHYIAEFCWPGMDPAVQREALEIFGERVLPLLR